MTEGHSWLHSRFVDVQPGQSIHVLEAPPEHVLHSRPPAVVFLHGFGGAAQGWISQMEFLRKRGIHSVALDQIGHGKTPYYPRRSIGEMAEDALAAIEQLGLGPVHLVAHSYGSPVAVEAANRAPEKIRGLVIINGFARHPEILKWRVRAGLWLQWIAGGTKEVQNAVLGNKPVPKVSLLGLDWARNLLKNRIDYETRTSVYEDGKRADAELKLVPPAEPNALINWFNAASSYVPPEHLGMPILVLHSLNDRIIPYGQAMEFQKYPLTRLQGINSMSHVLHRERQAQVNKAILDSLVGISPREFWRRMRPSEP